MHFRIWRQSSAAALFGVVAVNLLFAAAWPGVACGDEVVDKLDGTSSYLRVHDDSQLIALEIATRTFARAAPEDDGLRVALVGVAHIGDQHFYDAIAAELEGFEIVLYEGVAPPGVGRIYGETLDELIDGTRASLRFAASVVEAYRHAHETFPADRESLDAFVAGLDPIVTNWWREAMVDAWGNPVRYRRTDAGFELTSVGPTGVEVEEARRERLRVTHEHNVMPLALADDNIQKQLARALGLAYQLEALPYGDENWRLSDMSVNQLVEAFNRRGGNFEVVSGTLGGSSFPAQIAGLLLRIIEMLDSMMDGAISEVVKVTMIEILGDEEIIKASMGQMGAEFSEILIAERNQVVVDDLARLLADEPEVASIAILYGAAHMPDMARRLEQQLGFEEVADATWHRAISVNLAESTVDRRQLMQMRLMIRRSLQQQLRRMR